MLVDNDVYINKYVADGSTASFPIAFPFLEASHIEVYTRGEDGEDILVDPSMYTITGAGVEAGGELTFSTPPVAGTVIAIIRNVPITQLYAYTELDNFPAESHENALAKLTMIDQQQAEILGRALTLPVTSAKTPDQWISDFTNTMEQAVEDAQTAASAAEGSAQTASSGATTVMNAVAQINVTLSDITSAKNDALGAISTGTDNAISAVNTAKTTAVGIVSGEGDTQIARLQNYATGIITTATSLYKTVTITLDSDIASGTTITTPLVNGSALAYWVGKDMLGLSYNGVELYKDLQYQEVGDPNTASYQVKMLMPLYAGDQLCFKIMSAVVDSIVADPLQPDGTTIQLDANGKLSTVLTDQAILQAIGYTAADDSNVVKLSGDQTIAGTKTFSSGVYTEKSFWDKQDFAFGTWPGSTILPGVGSKDKNDLTGSWVGFRYASTMTSLRLYLRKSDDTGTAASSLPYVEFVYGKSNGIYSWRPKADNFCYLGDSSNRWIQLYATTTTISTSDERLKDNIEAVPDAVLDAWGDVNWSQFQFRDSIAKKGEDQARLHNGLVAQRIDAAFKAHGLDASRYGLFCYDEWEAQPEERDEHGNVTEEGRPAGNIYSLRYEEALCMEAAYQRRRADRAEARISALEQRMDELENVLITLGGHNND